MESKSNSPSDLVSTHLGGSMGSAIYSAADYVAQPITMIAAARFLLHHLGASQYGVWMLVMAIVGSLGVLGSGFGDATVKYVSEYRGMGNPVGLERVIRSTLTINSGLALILAGGAWLAAPYLSQAIFKIEPSLQGAAAWCFRIGAALLLLKSVESVFVSVLRGFEEYGTTVRISVFVRVFTILAAVGLTAAGMGIFSIMVATLVLAIIGLIMQVAAVQRVTGSVCLLPTFSSPGLSEVFSFGAFSWLQGLAAITFTHADRLVVGAFVGATAVAYYTICVQAAQPIHGIVSAAFNFIFPRASALRGAGQSSALEGVFWAGLALNVFLTSVISLPLILFSRPILRVWMGSDFAAKSHGLLSLLALAFAILSVNVVPHYVLLACNRVKFVSAVNIAGGALSLAAVAFLLPRYGLIGAAWGRLFYGPLVSLNLVAIYKVLRAPHSQKARSA